MKLASLILALGFLSQSCMTAKDKEIFAEVFESDKKVEATAESESPVTDPLKQIQAKPEEDKKKHAESEPLKVN